MSTQGIKIRANTIGAFKYCVLFTIETGYVCWAGVENIDDLRPLAPGSQGRVLSPTRQIDPPAAKFMTNSIKITKRLSEIKNDKKC